MGWLGLFDYLVQRDGISRFFLGWISIRLYRQSDVLSFNSVNSDSDKKGLNKIT